MTERQKMVNEQYYMPMDKELTQCRTRAHNMCKKINSLDEEFVEKRMRYFKKLFGTLGEGSYLEPGFKCDYGFNIITGRNFQANFNLTILDIAPIIFGNDVLIGPNVSIYSVNHPLQYKLRKTTIEYGKKIVIGDDVWLGGSVVICPGVTIGNGSIIGAGSVVVKDIPANSVAVGNPAKVVRTIDNSASDEEIQKILLEYQNQPLKEAL